MALPVPRSEPPPRRPVVLVVEDDEPTREALADALGESHTVLCARDVEDARSQLARVEVDAVVLDVMLGQRSGEELLEELTRRGSSAAVILVSGSRTGPKVARDYGVALVPKPFDLDNVIAAVDVALELGISPTRRLHPT